MNSVNLPPIAKCQFQLKKIFSKIRGTLSPALSDSCKEGFSPPNCRLAAIYPTNYVDFL
ncbi:hypothetical protein GK0417 [Geobacillus kaustophilus HTA426]|uniref:Uncharacterized protein n=1 Tax=Geobacillus kaustophilus (strain HTA426) TaxID=235909 RepID=Q5L2X8_GEOKA|nr:hypothetical protein GK0417 [Geobacillus kaustophilus HTA426]